MKQTSKGWVAVSGGFDPLHIGHIRMFREAKKLGDKLLVIINSDKWLVRKKGFVFMKQKEREEIIKAISCVDQTYIYDPKQPINDVCVPLQKFKPNIFANGGDRKKEADIPEAKLCKSKGIKMVFNVGGSKINSSSKLVKKAHEHLSNKT